MRISRLLATTFVAVVLIAGASTKSAAEVSISIGIAPVCPYGYFNYAPYQCAPFGYYGPQWYTGGVFIGAGPWFRGPVGFRGYIDHSYDPRFGYHGPFPVRGERADWGRHRGWEHQFHGNEFHQEHRDNGHHYGQYKEHGDHGDHGNARSNGHGNDHWNTHDNGHDHGHNDDHGHGHSR